MISNKKILAIIPARGGSKRIPKKNIVDLNGKPLLAHTVELAKQLPELDSIVVSSENDEILSIASEYGAETLRRPAELAFDDVKDEPVLIQALDALEKEGETFDYVVMLQVTSPLRKLETVKKVIDMAVNGDYDVVATVVDDRSYFRTFRDGVWAPVVPDAPRRTQEREPFYKEAGVCYIMKTKTLKETGKIFTGKQGFVTVDEIEGIDINTPFDLELIRFIKSKEN